MKRQRLFSSTERRKTPSGEAATRVMLAEDWQGKVSVSDFMRSVTEIRLPTGEIRRVLLMILAFPPLYGAPRRFWNLNGCPKDRS